jgi:hypothetical protein
MGMHFVFDDAWCIYCGQTWGLANATHLPPDMMEFDLVVRHELFKVMRRLFW